MIVALAVDEAEVVEIKNDENNEKTWGRNMAVLTPGARSWVLALGEKQVSNVYGILAFANWMGVMRGPKVVSWRMGLHWSSCTVLRQPWYQKTRPLQSWEITTGGSGNRSNRLPLQSRFPRLACICVGDLPRLDRFGGLYWVHTVTPKYCSIWDVAPRLK